MQMEKQKQLSFLSFLADREKSVDCAKTKKLQLEHPRTDEKLANNTILKKK